MSIYLVKLLDHGGNVWVADWVDCADDAHAIARAKQMDMVKIGIGYDVLSGDRLVFSHRRYPTTDGSSDVATRETG